MTQEGLQKLNLPDAPGVYFWKAGKEILYIGKATSLRDRVRSYFANDLIVTRGPRMIDMVTRAEVIEWQETDSVLEALILEANLIKKHVPHYNIKEKDDKSWNYVVITRERFPRVLIIRGRSLEVAKKQKELGVRYTFGPFPHMGTLRDALKIIRKMFPFIDRSSHGKDKYHFYRQLGLTPDTASEEARQEYLTHIKHIVMLFQGKKTAIARSLRNQMKEYADTREFEKADEVKRRLFALEHIRDISLIKDDVIREEDVSATAGFRLEAYDVAHMSGKESVGVMTVITEREVDKNQYRKFRLAVETGNNDVKNLEEIITRRFNHPEWRFPDIAVIDGGLAQKNLAEKLLAKLSPGTAVVSVVKDDKHKAREILGDKALVERYRKEMLLVNAEAHRFAITYHRKVSRLSHRRLAGFPRK